MKRLLAAVSLIILFISLVFAGSQQTSSTPASTIITNARYYLNDASSATAFWGDTELLAWVNHGTMDIVGRTRCLESSESVTLVPNTVEYSITGPYIDISTVVYNDMNSVKKGLVRKNPQSIGHSTDSVPTWWYEWNGKVGIFPALPLVTSAGLAIGSTVTAVSTIAFSYIISGTTYSKAAVPAGTAPGNDVVPSGKYGAVAFDIGSDGTIDATEAYLNSTGYTTAVLAVAGLPQIAKGHIRLGYVTATKSDGAFTFGTTSLVAANTTVVYSDSAPTATVYFLDKPTAVLAASPVLVPAVYDRALTLYVAAQALLKPGLYGKSGRLMAEYLAEIERYRLDFVERPKESEGNVTR